MDHPGFSVFDGTARIATGDLATAGLAARRAIAAQPPHPVLVIDDRSGRPIDLDLEGEEGELPRRLARIEARLYPPAAADSTADAAVAADAADAANAPGADDAATPRGRGRPKLGVQAREVTLLPRHWDWLATQRGGASVTLRRLVEEARRTHADKDRRRAAQERAYHFMLALAGDLPGYEEATRALFADDAARLEREMAAWPKDVREHALRLNQ